MIMSDSISTFVSGTVTRQLTSSMNIGGMLFLVRVTEKRSEVSLNHQFKSVGNVQVEDLMVRDQGNHQHDLRVVKCMDHARLRGDIPSNLSLP